MSVWDGGGDDIGGLPEQAEREGKDITDPAGGEPEIRGGESPADWTGPLPGKPYRRPQGQRADGDADWCGHPDCGGDL